MSHTLPGKKWLKFRFRTLVSLPKSLLKLIAGEPVVVDGQTLDTHCQLICKIAAYPPSLLESVNDYRHEYEMSGDLLGHEPRPGVDCLPLSIEGPVGPIPCEMHRPAELRDTKAPALIYYHGGGHCIGSLNTHRLACRQLSVAARCVVIAVDYRLAPEHKFPTGINDCLAVFDGVVQRSEEFGVAPEKIAVGGDSAGANISAVVAQQRKEPEYSPCFQLLIVPWLDLSKQARSYELFEKGFQLDKYTMEWYTNHYLVRPEDSLNPMASPALGEVEGVCPAAVIVAGFDPLRDEGLEYGNRLLAAGVDTTVRLHEGLIHPFMNFSGHVPVARSAFEDLARLLKDALYC